MCEGPGYAPVAAIEGVDGDEPQMRDPGFQDGIRRGCLEPVEEACHFLVQPLRCGGFVMDALTADRPGDNLHRPAFGGAPCAHGDAAHAAASGGEKRRVPAE